MPSKLCIKAIMDELYRAGGAIGSILGSYPNDVVQIQRAQILNICIPPRG